MRLKVTGNILVKRIKDAEKIIRRYRQYMIAVGYGVKEEWYWHDSHMGDILMKKWEPDGRSLLQLTYRKDDITKVRGKEIGAAVKNIMAACCKEMDCQSERIYMSIERVMDVRIDCCIAAG